MHFCVECKHSFCLGKQVKACLWKGQVKPCSPEFSSFAQKCVEEEKKRKEKEIIENMLVENHVDLFPELEVDLEF